MQKIKAFLRWLIPSKKTFFKCLLWRPQQVFCGGFLLAFASYVSIQKFGDVYIYDKISWFIPPQQWAFLKNAAFWLLLYASVVKFITYVLEFFPICIKKSQEPKRIAECLQIINNEIAQHLVEIDSDPKNGINTFIQSHNFAPNVAYILSNLAEHIKRAFPNVGKRDIFISLYESVYSDDGMCLRYVCHWEPTRDAIASKIIDPSKAKFKAYECVKAINTKKVTVAKLDCSDYKKTENNRGKKIKHYVGLHIEMKGQTLGFVNIEFHNRAFFNDEEEMLDFVENELVSFKYLVEYQLLKRKFFHSVKNQLMEDQT